MALGELDFNLASELGTDLFAPQATGGIASAPTYSLGGLDSGPSPLLTDAPRAERSSRISSLSDLLQSSDLGGLKDSYNSTLEKALSVPNRPEPKASSLFIQGGIPLALAAIFGGGDGIAAAADPVSNVVTRELKRATEAADNERTQALNTAKLIENRIGDVEDSFEKAAALEQRKLDNAASRDLREQQMEQTRAAQDTANELRRLSINQSADNARGRDADRDARMAETAAKNEDIVEEKLRRESDKVLSDAEKRLAPLRERLAGFDAIDDLASQPNAITDEALRNALVKNLGFDKGAIPEAQARRALPANVKGDVQTKVINYLTGKAGSGITPEVRATLAETMMNLKDMGAQRLNKEYDQISKQALSRANLHRKHERFSELEDSIRYSKPSILSQFDEMSQTDDATQNDLNAGDEEIIKTRLLDKYGKK